MGQCTGKTDKKYNENLNISQLKLPNTEYGDCSITRDDNAIINKIDFRSRFEQALKEGEDNDLRLVEKCRIVQKPIIFVSKQENSLYSKQKVLIELLNFRTKKSLGELRTKNRCVLKNYFFDRKALIGSKRFAGKVILKFRHIMNSRKYIKVATGRRYFGKRAKIELKNIRQFKKKKS